VPGVARVGGADAGGDAVTTLAGILAMSALIAWLARQPSAELFEEADGWFTAAERWEAKFHDEHAMTWCGDFIRRSHADSLETAHALTRKALRRMPWKLM
jgi:hypothetical protein